MFAAVSLLVCSSVCSTAGWYCAHEVYQLPAVHSLCRLQYYSTTTTRDPQHQTILRASTSFHKLDTFCYSHKLCQFQKMLLHKWQFSRLLLSFINTDLDRLPLPQTGAQPLKKVKIIANFQCLELQHCQVVLHHSFIQHKIWSILMQRDAGKGVPLILSIFLKG